MIRAMAFAGVAALLTGCAAHGPPPAASYVENSATPDPALAVAALLATADRAAHAGAQDRARLAAALTALDGYGARAVEASTDPAVAWRAALQGEALPPVRGRVLGPAYRRGTLEPGATMTLMQLFDGGRQARVAMATAGDTPIGIAVLDGTGKIVCPASVGRQGKCSWVPPFSGRHQIVLSNHGGAPSAYYLVID